MTEHKFTKAELKAAMENIPYAEDSLFTEEDLATGRVKFIGTGSVSFPITPELLKGLRATGRGWQVRAINYLMEGLKKGKLAASVN